MKTIRMPAGMWLLFAGSFRKQLIETLGYDAIRAREITSKAKRRYKRIIRGLPEFEKGDRFKMNIVSCAMLGAFLLEMPVKPTVGQAADYYREAMTTGAMKFFCRMGGKRKFTRKDIEGMKKTATLNAADRNPYSWNMTFHPYCGDASVLRQRVYADGFVFIIDNFRNMSAQYASKAEVATAVGRINHHYANTGKNLLLMAPGRVGSPSPELGVPTRFADISCFSEPLRDSAFSLWHRLRLDSGGILEYDKGDRERVRHREVDVRFQE